MENISYLNYQHLQIKCLRRLNRFFHAEQPRMTFYWFCFKCTNGWKGLGNELAITCEGAKFPAHMKRWLLLLLQYVFVFNELTDILPGNCHAEAAIIFLFSGSDGIHFYQCLMQSSTLATGTTLVAPVIQGSNSEAALKNIDYDNYDYCFSTS